MKFERLAIPDVIKIVPKSHEDSRGEFMETFKRSAFTAELGRNVEFLQENQSLSRQPYTVRGLHYQSPPFAQGKLVSCLAGEILDVAVDIRKASSSYGTYVSEILSAENKAQLWIPEGFLHGFATLAENTVVQYKCSHYYSAEHEGSLMWDDTNLDIDWGFAPKKAILSDKDKAATSFADFRSPF